jgi:hypothetical protein
VVSITSYRRQSIKSGTKSSLRVARKWGAIQFKNLSSQDIGRGIGLASGPGYVFKAQLQKEFLLAAQGSWQTFELPR